MITNWFFTQFPPSRFVIEGEIRNALWQGGLTDLWLSCTHEEPPYEIQGFWQKKEFNLEWDGKTYIMLKTKEPDPELLERFERVLKHRALAAYKNGDGMVVVEWLAKDADARFQELRSGGAQDLERLNQP